MWRDRFLQVLLLSGVTFLALAGFLVWRTAQQQAAGLGPRVTVWTAARALQPDTLLEPTDLAPRSVPRTFLLPGAITDPEDAAGRVVIAPVPAGEPLMAYVLAAPDLTDPELRRFDLREEGNVTLPGHLAPGDRVDILVAGRQDPVEQAAWVLLADIKVLQASEGKQRAVALAVTLDQAQDLLYHLNYSKEVRLLRRGPGGGGT